MTSFKIASSKPQTVISNFIDGKYALPAGRNYLDVHEPATGRVYARVPASDQTDVDRAVKAAQAAFPGWAATSPDERSRKLLRVAELIDDNSERLAEAESRDTGKPVSLARTVDIPRAAGNFRFFATAILHAGERMYHTETSATGRPVNAMNYTQRRPRGVAGLISPWNLPLYLLTWKIAPAIATGNTCVAKPSEITPSTAWLLGDILSEAGIPPGVVNIVHGTGPQCGAEIVKHADVPTISFTGSTAVGKWVAQTAGGMLKRVSLELGGKNAAVVFDDVDLNAAVELLVRAAFTNQGQICLCCSRVLVQETIYEKLLAALVRRTENLKVGDPLDPTTKLGALTSQAHLKKVDTYARLARDFGGTIHTGGAPVDPAMLPESCREGYFYPATIVSGLDPSSRVEQEEIFGPIITLQPFRDEAHAIKLANGTAYGLAATILTRDLTRAHRVASELEAGIIWINCWMLRDLRTPFGGMKQSGVGREGGVDSLEFFTEPKNICIKI